MALTNASGHWDPASSGQQFGLQVFGSNAPAELVVESGSETVPKLDFFSFRHFGWLMPPCLASSFFRYECCLALVA